MTDITGPSPIILLESAVYWCLRSELPDDIEFEAKISNRIMTVHCEKFNKTKVSEAMKKCFILSMFKNYKLVWR